MFMHVPKMSCSAMRPSFAVAPVVFCFGALALLIPVAARADEQPGSPALQAALTAAVTVPGARVEVVAWDQPVGDCVTAGHGVHIEVARPIDGSGRVAVKVTGTRRAGGGCEAWAWARVRVFAPVPIAARAIRAGEPLGSAIHSEEREIKAGHVPAVLSELSIADRTIGSGQMIEAGAVSAPGPRAGQPIKILIVSAALAVEQIGRAVACGRDSSCAVLPSGKHVEGTFADGRLTVRLP